MPEKTETWIRKKNLEKNKSRVKKMIRKGNRAAIGMETYENTKINILFFFKQKVCKLVFVSKFFLKITSVHRPALSSGILLIGTKCRTQLSLNEKVKKK